MGGPSNHVLLKFAGSSLPYSAGSSLPYSATRHAAVAVAEWLAIEHDDAGIRVSL